MVEGAECKASGNHNAGSLPSMFFQAITWHLSFVSSGRRNASKMISMQRHKTGLRIVSKGLLIQTRDESGQQTIEFVYNERREVAVREPSNRSRWPYG